MRYQIENIQSGHVFGISEGDTPEAAIQAMMDDAKSSDSPSDDVRAYPMTILTGMEAIEYAEEHDLTLHQAVDEAPDYLTPDEAREVAAEDPSLIWLDYYSVIDDELLKEAVEGVEENNRINDGRWSDWQDAADILEVYCDGKTDPYVIEILDRAIETNGESLAADLAAVERAVMGQNFSGSFWDRGESKPRNLVQNYIDHHGDTRSAVAAINGSLGTDYPLSRIYDWRGGNRAVPQPVQDLMLAECLGEVCRQIASGKVSVRQGADRLIPPRRYKQPSA